MYAQKLPKWHFQQRSCRVGVACHTQESLPMPTWAYLNGDMKKPVLSQTSIWHNTKSDWPVGQFNHLSSMKSDLIMPDVGLLNYSSSVAKSWSGTLAGFLVTYDKSAWVQECATGLGRIEGALISKWGSVAHQKRIAAQSLIQRGLEGLPFSTAEKRTDEPFWRNRNRGALCSGHERWISWGRAYGSRRWTTFNNAGTVVLINPLSSMIQLDGSIYLCSLLSTQSFPLDIWITPMWDQIADPETFHIVGMKRFSTNNEHE